MNLNDQIKIIKPKAGILELAKQLGNVSQFCKIMGYSSAEFISKPLQIITQK